MIGVPLGIWGARNRRVEVVLRSLLDFMQTMPAFVYLIPAVILFGLGRVPAVIATIVFAMPPVVRLTTLGIRQVREELLEAGRSFGSTDAQLLWKIQLPNALPSIMAGVNQTIMMALSMVVVASMIGAGGLGEYVLSGIQRLDIGIGFEGGLGVVLLAIILDRLTESFGVKSKKKKKVVSTPVKPAAAREHRSDLSNTASPRSQILNRKISESEMNNSFIKSLIVKIVTPAIVAFGAGANPAMSAEPLKSRRHELGRRARGRQCREVRARDEAPAAGAVRSGGYRHPVSGRVARRSRHHGRRLAAGDARPVLRALQERRSTTSASSTRAARTAGRFPRMCPSRSSRRSKT